MICCSCKLELYAVVIYYILDVFLHCQTVVLLCNFNFAIKFLLLFWNFRSWEQTALLIGQLTIVVRIAHFIIRFRNVFRCFTVVILLKEYRMAFRAG